MEAVNCGARTERKQRKRHRGKVRNREKKTYMETN